MNLEPYPEYKDSGVEWIDQIPEEWEVKKLKNILIRLTDGSHTSVEILSEGYPFVTVTDLDENEEKIDLRNCKRISKNDFDFLIRNGCNPKIGDILFSQIGTIGLVVPVKDDDNFVMLSSLAILTPSNEVDSRWLVHFLRSDFIKNQNKTLMAGGAVKRITLDHISNFTIISPSFKEQQNVSSFLDKKISEIDLTIEKDTRLIELLKEKRTALINHVVTKGLDPTVKMKDSVVEWIGKIPEDWEVLPLFALFKERKVKNIRNREENVLSLSYGRIVRRNVETNFGLLPESFETYNIVEPGCIVLRLTDLQNDKKSLRTGLVKEKGIITSAYLSLEKRKDFDVNYAHYLLHAYDLVKVFYSLGGGVRQSMRYEDMKKMPLLYPSIEEQIKISNYIDEKTEKLDDFILKISKHIKLLEEYKKSLIHHVVTGKVDVREVAV